MITAESLTHIPLFAFLPDEERGSLAGRAADVRLKPNEWLLVEGQAPSFFAVLEGQLAVLKSIAGHERQITTYGPGEYFGEVPLLLGSPAVASVRALEETRLMRLDPIDFHDLISHCRVLNGEIMKTMAFRVGALGQRVADTPTAVASVIGRRNDPGCLEIRDFLSRNRVVFHWRDLDDPEAIDRLVWDEVIGARHEAANAFAGVSLPLVLFADGRRMEAPSCREVADAVGLQTAPGRETYDVVIVGGGPAGLAAAVYGASEGLCTLLVERVACGGQAGTSSRIENYLGFPGGLSGDDLSTRARQQALKFGAELLVARSVESIQPGDPHSAGVTDHTIVLDDGTRLTTKAVVMATGVQWRRLDTPGLDRLTGHGVYYGAAATEAHAVRGCHIHIIGGGNSAGQAAMMFANYAESVTMLVRGKSLAASMSQYLIDQLSTKSNVTIETEAEVVAVEGGDRLEALELEIGPSRRRERCASNALFVFIGAHAETGWLPEKLICDEWGYVCAGRDVMDLLEEREAGTWPLERDPYLLETSVPGIFAAGDVRHGSIKRVASSVGEGSMAIAFVHQYLAEVAEQLNGAVAQRRGSPTAHSPNTAVA
ncbi:MAG TPA: FAD-dependent oxidoreductase [Gemmatimonadaceae bacterium]|nr:FAD-dependent oxidoreductase [Gemmatimonadaceae bacterium]